MSQKEGERFLGFDDSTLKGYKWKQLRRCGAVR